MMINDENIGDKYDSGNRRHVERAAKTAKSARRERDQALCWLMADRRGRLLIWDMLTKAGVFRSSMAPTPELTAFNEGRRDGGLALLVDLMRLCPDAYVRMQAEAQPLSSPHSNPGETDDGRNDSEF